MHSRDLKPQNVLVQQHPVSQHPVAKVTDFGLSKVLSSEMESHQMSKRLGTEGWAAPEQRQVTTRSRDLPQSHKVDVYPFGIMLGCACRHDTRPTLPTDAMCTYRHALAPTLLCNARGHVYVIAPPGLSGGWLLVKAQEIRTDQRDERRCTLPTKFPGR